MNSRSTRLLLAGLAIAALSPLRAADAALKPDAWGVSKPAWLDASLGLMESHDSNVFGVSVNPVGRANVADQGSWVSTVSPKLTVDALPLCGLSGAEGIKTLTIGYAGEYSVFDHTHSEDNAKHTVVMKLKGGSGAWSFGVDNAFLYVDGSRVGPTFATASAYSSALPRERRNQIQERPAASLRFDTDRVFLRALASASYFNLLVDHHQPVGARTGYINFVNRSDANFGVDLGYKVSDLCSYLVGWRLGQQIQARMPWGGTHSNNTYNRLVAGFEGKLLPWLSGSAMVGPDFRRYSDAPNLGITGASHTWLYAEGSLTAKLSAADSLKAATKVWHWVSSTGSTSYQDATYAIAYTHTFDRRFSVSPGVKFLAAKYDYPAVRNDQVWAFSMNATYVVSRELSVSADYFSQQSRSRIPESIGPGRSFDQNVVSLSVKLAL